MPSKGTKERSDTLTVTCKGSMEENIMIIISIWKDMDESSFEDNEAEDVVNLY